MSIDLKINQIAIRGGFHITNEQKEIIKNSNNSMLVSALPGTGKTHTLINVILAAQLLHGTKPSEILVSSFTNASTNEIAARYEKAKRKIGVYGNAGVVFSTLHAMCKNVIKERYPNIRITKQDLSSIIDQLQPIFEDACANASFEYEAYGLEQLLVRIYKVIDTLNSRLIYDTEHILSLSLFTRLKIPIEVFNELRKYIVVSAIMMGSFDIGAIPNAALYIILDDEELRKKVSGKYKLLIIDEMQDASVALITLVSILADKVIAVGDINQQIYGFAGASVDVYRIFSDTFPDAKHLSLTRSFRCCQEVLDAATDIIRPNYPFKIESGTGTNVDVTEATMTNSEMYHFIETKEKINNNAGVVGKVEHTQSKGTYCSSIISRIAESTQGDKFATFKHMILSRNGDSCLSAIEALYQAKIPFLQGRKEYKTVYESLPFFREAYSVIALAYDLTSTFNIEVCLKMLDRYDWVYGFNHPVVTLHKSLPVQETLEVTYNLAVENGLEPDPKIEALIFIANKVAGLVTSNCLASVVHSILVSFYEDTIMNGKLFLLPSKLSWYMYVGGGVMEGKTIEAYLQDEATKKTLHENYYNGGYGVRVYTIHRSKGLEADNVYILDADDGIIPNDKELDKIPSTGLNLLEKARTVREERNLLYVAMTRARYSVLVLYNDVLTDLISKPAKSKYTSLDDAYFKLQTTYDEISAFKRLCMIDVSDTPVDDIKEIAESVTYMPTDENDMFHSKVDEKAESEDFVSVTADVLGSLFNV